MPHSRQSIQQLPEVFMRWSPIGLALALSACANAADLRTQVDVVKAEAVKTAADVADRAADDAEFIICNGITVGAWRRKYGTTAERAAAWRALCSQPVVAAPGPVSGGAK